MDKQLAFFSYSQLACVLDALRKAILMMFAPLLWVLLGFVACICMTIKV
jgi:hypothetical protein